VSRAVYSMTVIDENAFVIDQDAGMSVTNDAEAVVGEVLGMVDAPIKRIVYRDTEGRWDELKHDGRRFVGFWPIRPEDPIRSDIERLAP
jgi:hypothetical protein